MVLVACVFNKTASNLGFGKYWQWLQFPKPPFSDKALVLPTALLPTNWIELMVFKYSTLDEGLLY
jgi:hypothetical protein